MNNPAPPASPTLESIDGTVADGVQALRTGLELARASQLTMLRLQLALHKSNRRTAMQTLDDLLDIDAEMAGLAAALTGVPAHLADGAALSDFIGHQRAAIAIEKHGLTGGQLRSETQPMAIAAPVDQAPPGADLLAQPPLAADVFENDVRVGNRRWLVLAAALILTLIGLGLAAYLWPALRVTMASFFG